MLCLEDAAPITPGGQWLDNASFAAFPVFLGIRSDQSLSRV